MNQKIKFSIIMPFYNSEDYLDFAIKSIINQKYENWELIAVNDGSSDSSFNIAKKYEALDSRIRVLSKRNGGYATAINYGLERLSKDSSYFLNLGSDDYLLCNTLSNIVEKIGGFYPDVISFITIKNIDGKKEIDQYTNPKKDLFYNGSYLDFCKELNPPSIFSKRDSSKCFKTSMLKDLRMFGKYGIYSDDFFSILFVSKCSSFAALTTGAYVFNIRNESVSMSSRDVNKKSDIFFCFFSFFDYCMRMNITLQNAWFVLHFKLLFIEYVLDKNVYIRIKKYVSASRRILFYMCKKYNQFITAKEKLIILFPSLIRLYLKHKNS